MTWNSFVTQGYGQNQRRFSICAHLCSSVANFLVLFGNKAPQNKLATDEHRWTQITTKLLDALAVVPRIVWLKTKTPDRFLKDGQAKDFRGVSKMVPSDPLSQLVLHRHARSEHGIQTRRTADLLLPVKDFRSSRFKAQDAACKRIR